MRRLWTIFMGCALALLVATAAGAADDPCETSAAGCDFEQDSQFVLPAEATQISALVPIRSDNGPRALESYAKLLPPPYSMPAQPRVALWLTRAKLGSRGVPGDSWIEGTVALRAKAPSAKAGSEEGWFMLANPVTTESAYQLGRDAGWPKYMAGATLAQTGTGFTGRVSVKGRESMLLEWNPAPIVSGKEDVEDWTFKRQPYLALFTALKGPDALRTKFTLQTDPLSAPPRDGLVRYRLDGDLDRLDAESPEPLPDLLKQRGVSLGDVVALEGLAPAQLHEASGNVVLQTRRIGRGGYGTGPGGTTPGTDGKRAATRRSCVRRSVTIRVRTLGGGRLRAARAVAGKRRLRTRLLRGGRVRVGLRGVRARRVKIVLRVRSARGERVQMVRTYRMCRSRAKKRR